MVKNGWTEKIEELEKENKGYEVAYTRAVLKNEESKKYDRWFANLCFREKLSLLDRHDIDDWFELTLKEKQSVYEGEQEIEEELTELEKRHMYADKQYQALKEDDF